MPRRPPLRYGWRGAAVVASILATTLLAGCSPGQVRVADDPQEPGTSAVCSALIAALPDTVNGQSRRDPTPDLPNVAVWGDPPILLRCGVPRPVQYAPSAQVFPIDDVAWLPVTGVNGEVFFATGRTVWVRVDVPEDYAPEANVLVDLAAALSTVPTTPPTTPPPATTPPSPS